MKLIDKKELTFGRQDILSNATASLVMKIFGMDQLNKIYEQTYHSGENCASDILSRLDITYETSDKDRTNIPSKGGVIVVSNHPTGAMEGVILIDLLSKIRPDIKFIGNHILNRVESLSRYFIPVDPVHKNAKTINASGIKKALQHVKNGGALAIFPAGAVATWTKIFGRVREREWQMTCMKMLHKADVPIIPMHIQGRNSFFFHLLGYAHPLMRSALLPRQILNKKGSHININIGSAITPDLQKTAENLEEYRAFIRANTELLAFRKENKIYKTHNFKAHLNNKKPNTGEKCPSLLLENSQSNVSIVDKSTKREIFKGDFFCNQAAQNFLRRINYCHASQEGNEKCLVIKGVYVDRQDKKFDVKDISEWLKTLVERKGIDSSYDKILYVEEIRDLAPASVAALLQWKGNGLCCRSLIQKTTKKYPGSELLKNIKSPQLLNKIVSDIENGNKSIPDILHSTKVRGLYIHQNTFTIVVEICLSWEPFGIFTSHPVLV